MLIRRFVLLFSVCASLSAGAYAQLGIPTVRSSSDKDAIELNNLKINVDVIGNVATTTFDMTFYNTGGNVLEGEFEFPLAEGQSVSRYALDINGKLREGVVVEKERGRVVFESKVREGVDPGLLEMTAGNNFRTRIYPFQPHGVRHVVVACEQELSISNGKRYYRLPINTATSVKDFSLEIKVRNEVDKPVLAEGSIDDLYFSPNDQGYTSALYRKNITLNKGLFLELPKAEIPKVYIENAGVDSYFYLYSSMNPKQSIAREKPKGLTVIYDVSSSSNDRNGEKDFELLEDYAKYLGISRVRLLTFSCRQHLDTICKVADVKKIINPKKSIFDGATNIGCIDFSKYGTDEILFFSDGLGNIGKDSIPSTKATVMTINSSPVADPAYLKMLALKNGGTYLNLCTLNREDALKALTNVEYRFLKAQYDASQISEVYPSVPTRVTESFSLSGIMRSKEADITLYFGYANQITDSVRCHVSAIDPTKTDNVKRLWAQRKLADLDLEPEKNKQEIINLSKKYGIVTRNTSLIVLETVYDYVRYEITPPDELRDEYYRLMANKPKSLRNGSSVQTDSLHFSKILRSRESFLKWWKTDYDPKAKYKDRGRILSDSISDSQDDGIDISASNATSEPADEVPTHRSNTVSIRGVSSLTDISAEKSVETSYARSVSVDQALAGRVSGVQVSSSQNSALRSSSSEELSVNVQYWTPDVPYLSDLKSVATNKMYDAYLGMKPKYSISPSFYLDVAEYFHREKLTAEAIRIVSNLAEMKLEDAEVARSCANKLVEFKSYELAVSVFERVVKMRGEEPQSYRDLALVYIELGQYQKAADLLYKVGSSQWDSRFKNIQQIAINELNALIELHPGKIDTSAYDKRLMGNCPVDIRVILTWNTNDCDIDLWVTDPNGEKCFYSHKETVIGGRISDDITRGYGPEEFCLKNAIKGEYLIQANYFGTANQRRLQPVVVQATIYTHFGMPNQKKQVLTIQLGSANDVYTVGTIKM